MKTATRGRSSSRFKGKTILITGGTGSFGNAVTARLLRSGVKRVVIFSRDEKKQFDMGNTFHDDRLKFVVGDVRDRASIDHAMEGVNYVFHAAALKQVPTCEFFPMQAVYTNILGSYNVIESAVKHRVERVVVLSTDKACAPINAMGMTKALMERVMIAEAREQHGETILCGTRYGNVMYTRGSVIPFFVEQMQAGKPLTLTHGGMTRFMMSLEDSIDLVLFALEKGKPGEIYVTKAPAATIADVAAVLKDIFSYRGAIKEIGIRPGEKIHEALITREEKLRTIDQKKYFTIVPESMHIDYREYHYKGHVQHRLPEEGYTSANTARLSRSALKKLLLTLPEIRSELARVRSQ
ncbi:MAG: SDR family NAD(P)-dependent oxidoreductase [Candidatus Kaiserbacteria bacterium]|nr:MAG: SDR family NAD(P)-dependent oxidoreductase [Candidatus Kaiserbacteria bacterium]